MRIGGFQPMTLLDFPGRVAAIVFTQGCPFACTYCHNPELLPYSTGNIEEEQVVNELEKRSTFLDGVVITGGEPTIQPDLPQFIKKIRSLSLEVKLDTNGVHPEMIKDIAKKHLVQFFAMDIKIAFDKYDRIVGNVPKKVKENCKHTMEIIARSKIPYELRTTVDSATHAKEDILEIVKQLPMHTKYVLQGIRRQKTLGELPEAREPLDEFLRHCKDKIAKERPDVHVIIR